MMKYIWRFHDWYDQQQEPRRFMIMLAIAGPMITANLWVRTLTEAVLLVAYTGLALGTRMYRHHTGPRRRAQ